MGQSLVSQTENVACDEKNRAARELAHRTQAATIQHFELSQMHGRISKSSIAMIT